MRRSLLFAPFLILAALFAGTDLLAMQRASQLRAEAERIEADMLSDIELVSRMQHDLARVNLLANQYVAAAEAAARTPLAARIAQTEAEYASAAAKYESTPPLPGEEAPVQALKTVVADIRPRLDAVLELSRADDPVAARRELADLQGAFDLANDRIRTLIDFNHRAARESLAMVASLQKSSTTTVQVLAVAGVALSLVLGAATVREVRRRNEELRLYADRLEASNRELDTFAGRVAHDLRAPLTTATLATSRLSRASSTPEQTKTFGALQRSFLRMGDIIHDLLVISRVQAGGSVATCDPAAAAEQLREELAPRMEGGDVRVVIDVQPGSVRCPEGLLREVMWNLADNAIKYRRTEVRSFVEICGRAVDDRYELSVRDNGIGISPEETGKVFEPFYRRPEGTQAPPGTGLGLSIVKRALVANGGTVSLESELGVGSKFVARLLRA